MNDLDMNLDWLLARAESDIDARALMHSAIRELWPTMPPYRSEGQKRWRDCVGLLDGPPAGWIGVGILMLPEGSTANVDVGAQMGTAEVLTADGSGHFVTTAKRPDCALVLAARRAHSVFAGTGRAS